MSDEDAMKNNGMRHGEQLRQLLEAAGVSQAELARVAELSRGAVNNWCKADQFPPSVWIKIKEACGKLDLDITTIIDPNGADAKALLSDFAQADFSPKQACIVREFLKADAEIRQQLLSFLDGVAWTIDAKSKSKS